MDDGGEVTLVTEVTRGREQHHQQHGQTHSVTSWRQMKYNKTRFDGLNYTPNNKMNRDAEAFENLDV